MPGQNDIPCNLVSVYSDLYGEIPIYLYDVNGRSYATAETIGKLSGLNTSVSSPSTNIFSIVYTDEMRTVYIDVDESGSTIMDTIGGKPVTNSSGQIIYNAIDVIEYNNSYLLEAIPLLKYLGANVSEANDKLYFYSCSNSIWSVLPEAFDNSRRNLILRSKYCDNVENQLKIDVLLDFASDLNCFRTIEDYYTESIYDFLNANPYNFDSVEAKNNSLEEKLEKIVKDNFVWDTTGNLSEIITESIEKLEEMYFKPKIEISNLKANGALYDRNMDDYIKYSCEAEAETQRMVKDIGDEKNIGNLDVAGFLMTELVYAARIRNTYENNLKYSSKASSIIFDEVESMRYMYNDVSSIKWLNTAEKIGKNVTNEWDNLQNTLIDNTREYIVNEGMSAITGALCPELELSIQAYKTLVSATNAKYIEHNKKNLELFLSEDIINQSYNLCVNLYDKASNESFKNKETIYHLVNALRFYYQYRIAYNKSLCNFFEYYNLGELTENFKQNINKSNDELASIFFDLTNCSYTVGPWLGEYSDVLSQEDVVLIRVKDIKGKPLMNLNIETEQTVLTNFYGQVTVAINKNIKDNKIVRISKKGYADNEIEIRSNQKTYDVTMRKLYNDMSWLVDMDLLEDGSKTFVMNKYLVDNYSNEYSSSIGVDCGYVSYDIEDKGYTHFRGTVGLPKEISTDGYKSSAKLQIYVDDVLSFESDDISNGSKIQKFDVNISNAKIIKLSWDCKGMNIWNNWCYFATVFNPYCSNDNYDSSLADPINNRNIGLPDILYLSDMELFADGSDNAEGGKSFMKNQYLVDNHNNTYSTSLGLKSGYISYLINGMGYTHLYGNVGLPKDISTDGYKSSAKLYIYVDDNLAFESEKMTNGSQVQKFDINIANSDVIRFSWTCEGMNIWNNWGYFATIYDAFLAHDNYISNDDSNNIENTSFPDEQYLAEMELFADGSESILGTEKSYMTNTYLEDNVGNVYTSSFGVDSGYVSYLLKDKDYKKLHGTVALPNGIEPDSFKSSAQLEIYADEYLVYTSEKVDSDTKPQVFDIDISGVEVLRFSWSS